MSQNSLLHPLHELYYDRYKPQDAKEALTLTEQQAREKVAAVKVIPDQKRTIANTLLGLTRATEEFDKVCGVIGHLDSVLSGPWQKAGVLASARASALATEISLDADLYNALLALNKLPAAAQASPPQRKLLIDMIKQYERDGVGLPAAQKQQLKHLAKKLSKASTQFGQNCVKAQDAAGLHVTDAAALAGLDADLIAEAKAAAKQKKLPGYWLHLSSPTFVKVMSECRVRATRFAAYQVMRSFGLEPNEPLAKEILKLRYQTAKLLGYQNFADLTLSDRMAKTGTAAREFVHQLFERYQPYVAEQNAALLAFAREYEHDPKLQLHISDVDAGLDLYYAARQREKLFKVDEAAAREYFALPNVLNGMFQVLHTLYGVSFKQLPKTPAWHPDVTVYAIYDEAGAHVATVWCDWYARKGKHNGAWMNTMYIADRSNGNVARPHLGQVCANLQPPAGDKPSLLNFRDVETVWHEFGHFMHQALSRPELTEHLAQGIEWDFIEAPSQIMENWPRYKEVLQLIAKHYKTGKVIPHAMITQMQAAQNFRVASKAMYQLGFAEADLALHMDFADADDIDVLGVRATTKKRSFGLEPEPYDKGILSFTHIFAGGYAAGYYSYKWAEAIEADFFEQFAEDVLSPVMGRKYRDTVLARGSEVEAGQIVRDFLGRDSTVDAMLRRDGLI